MRGEGKLSSRLARVAALAPGGDGITEDGIYVPLGVPGDLLEMDVEGTRSAINAVVERSPDSAVPPCPHFGICGACQMQHVAHEVYRVWKRDNVVRALAHARIEVPVAELIDAHGEGRRRVTLALKHGVAGYHERGSHTVMAAEVCPILSPSLSGVLAFARALAAEVPDRWLSMLVTGTQTGMDADLKGPLHGNARLNARLAGIAREHRLARLTAEREPIALYRTPSVAIGPAATLVLPAGAFLQATLKGEEVLAKLAGDGLRHARRVADLFCGVGPFALRLAPWSQVYAADSDGLAIAALRRAAAVPGFKPVNAERRDLFRRPLVASELDPFDAIVLDPPFDGAVAQVAEIAASRVPVLRYVSCNPKTFARDALMLIAAGYRLVSVTPVDQFLYSTHVELVGAFER